MCDILEEDYESALRNIRQGISCRDESVMRELLYNEIVVYERQLDFETAQSKMRSFWNGIREMRRRSGKISFYRAGSAG